MVAIELLANSMKMETGDSGGEGRHVFKSLSNGVGESEMGLLWPDQRGRKSPSQNIHTCLINPMNFHVYIRLNSPLTIQLILGWLII